MTNYALPCGSKGTRWAAGSLPCEDRCEFLDHAPPSQLPAPTAATAQRRVAVACGHLRVKPALRLALLASVLLLGLLAAVVAAALQGEPRVTTGQEVGLDDVARALSLLRTHDPRQAHPGQVSTALVQQRDVEVLLSHGARRWIQAASQVDMQRGGATVNLSLPLAQHPLGFFGRWLNVEVQLAETNGLPALDGVRVGRLQLPGWLAERLLQQAVARAGLQAETELLADVVRRVRFMPQQMLVTYAWQGDSARRLMSGLLPADELERLRAYSARLAEVVARQRSGWEMPMAQLVQPLFELARQRSAADSDAVAENRAALTVLALFANGRNLGEMIPAARSWPRARPVRLLLAGRQDFPLHFLVSAALAVESTSPLSKAIGVYKEVKDSRGGSGFSFSDMAANRAGTRFGEKLLQEPAQMQQRLARGVTDAELVPPAQDLPEFMPEADFLRRFGGVGAPAYNALLAEIDRRIEALPLLR